MFRLTKKKSAPELHEALHFIPMAGPNGKGHAEMAICISDCVPQTEKEHHSTQTDFRTDIKPTSTGIHIASSPIINDTESRQTPLLETNLVSNFVETVSKTDPTSLKNKCKSSQICNVYFKLNVHFHLRSIQDKTTCFIFKCKVYLYNS